MATYGKKQVWQCHEILNESERMSNSEKKGGVRYNYAWSGKHPFANRAGKLICFDRTWSCAPYWRQWGMCWWKKLITGLQLSPYFVLRYLLKLNFNRCAFLRMCHVIKYSVSGLLCLNNTVCIRKIWTKTGKCF